ncbi:hypothetical protein PWT90_10756 [Aphanocladium album]|nr:hypothetical protein PWT90_10756 [Aphanocladium album]
MPGQPQRRADKAERCAIRNFMKDTSFLDCVEGIGAEEFLQRRNRLAKVLKDEGVAAFVIEPGYTFEYYANVSQKDWAPYEQDDRPFLMVIQPEEDDQGAVVAKTSFLAPHFEVGRVRMLSIPRSEPELDVVVWEEHWNPYATLRRSRLFPAVAPLRDNPDEVDQRPLLVADPETRSRIVGGLWDAGFRFQGASPAVRALPHIKTDAEVAILRAVNTASAAAVRAVRPCLVPGLTEDDARRIVRSALAAAGMQASIDIVLFDEDGALPHGGLQTGRKVRTYRPKFNKGERLRPGMVLVVEPGVYLEERFGVRLGDVYLVKEDGEPELLSGGLSRGLDDP